jgi:hypothetical protein
MTAEKNPNAPKDLVSILKVLERIEGEVKGARVELTGFRDRPPDANVERAITTIGERLAKMTKAIASLNEDVLINLDLERRIARLEAAVFKTTES